jgi:hypothetical protein
MKLIVRFESKNSIRLPAVEIGLAKVKQIEAELGHSVNLDLFDPYSANFISVYAIVSIEREMAEASGHFENANEIRANMPDNWLDKFFVLLPEIKRAPGDGAISRVDFRYKLDKDKLLATWEDLGFPLEIEE